MLCERKIGRERQKKELDWQGQRKKETGTCRQRVDMEKDGDRDMPRGAFVVP